MRTYAGLYVSFIALLSPSIVFAQKATDEDMSRSAIMSTVLSSDQSIINEEVLNSRNQIKSLALSDRAEDLFSATVVFANGKNALELEKLSVKYELEVSRAEAKNAVGNDGNILTISIGSRDLLIL